MVSETGKEVVCSQGSLQDASSISAAQPVDAHAHAQIQAILKVKVQELPTDLAEVLERLPASTSSASIGPSGEWDPSLPAHEPRACCFGTASAGRPCAWTAHALCERCKVFQALLQSSDCDKAALAKVFSSTECSESVLRKKSPAGLPIEVVQMIIDDVVEQFKATKDGTAICKLLHTSCYIRAKLVTQYFEPIELLECCDRYHENRSPFKHVDFHVHLPKAIGAYVADSVAYVTLDFSVRRDASKPQHPASIGQLFTTFGLPMVWTGACMNVRSDVLGCSKDHTSQVHDETYTSQIDDLYEVDATGSSVFCMLKDTIHNTVLIHEYNRWPSPRPKKKTLDELLRNINPCQRALNGSFAVSTKRGVAISVQLRLQNFGIDDFNEFSRWFCYDTLRVREGTVAPKLPSWSPKPEFSDIADLDEEVGDDVHDDMGEQAEDEEQDAE